MVELTTRKWEMRRGGGNHDEKPGLARISCPSQFPIPDTVGMSSDPACNCTDRRSSQPNQASCTADSSYLSVFITSFSLSSTISLCLVHNSTIIAEHQVKSSLSNSPCHDQELTPSTAYTEYKHTPSTSKDREQHTPSTPYPRDWRSSLHSHDYKLTPECSFSFRRAPLHNWQPSASSLWEHNGKVDLSHSHGCELTNLCIESQHPVRRPSTASEYSSNHARSLPPSVSPNSQDHGLQVYLQTHSIMACKFARASSLKRISKLARSWPPSASPTSLDHGLQVHLQTCSITASKCISKLPPLWPPSSCDHGLQVHLQTRLMMILECISMFGPSRSPSVSPNTLEYCLQVHLPTHSIMPSECISELTWLSVSGAPRIALEHRLQPVQIYRVQMGSYIDT